MGICEQHVVIRSPRKEGELRGSPTPMPSPWKEPLQRLGVKEVWEGAGARMALWSGVACDRSRARSAGVPPESQVEKTRSADVSQPLPQAAHARGRRAGGSMAGAPPPSDPVTPTRCRARLSAAEIHQSRAALPRVPSARAAG